ncbi:hypothetical protein EG68_09721 [Paragonimus skrjabini miyazakii]|uniref:Uncharacterized protein n=1 Tax=Paragonimus skrjabini miyazakii TaxID=59628 RepID=A0A8S9YGR1_9TREM|nr:hypothetical protein EG68_09721 [Paragonimus skrjabini miyazakii]
MMAIMRTVQIINSLMNSTTPKSMNASFLEMGIVLLLRTRWVTLALNRLVFVQIYGIN